MIRVSELCFDYPGRRALNNLSFHIAKGSVTALVGSNGAGKTTLMRCIAGLDMPLSGSIEVAGIDVLEQPRASHRLLGYLSDSFGLYQDLSVAQCLAYAASAQGLPADAIEAAVNSTAQDVGLADRLEHIAGSLSRGMRQRVAIGQAIIHQPQLLILDEPASGLDPESRAELASLFRRLASKGMTLLVSSHILAELDEYSTAMLALREGEILEQRDLSANSAHEDQQRLVIGLCHADNRLLALLEAAGAIIVDAESLQVVCHFSADVSAQASLLSQLVQAGLPICAFGAQKENLQQSYLRSIAKRTEERKA